LRNCTFDSGAEAWGILIEVGTPAQRLCLSPSTVSNSTLLSLESLCAISDPGMSRRKCQSLRGGFYNESQSRTWTGASLATFNASRHEPTWAHFNPPGITRVGYDTVRFPGASGSGSGARRDVPTLHGYGVALNERGNQSNAGMLGLGVDSLFLARAVHDNLSPARGWSLFAGSQSPARPSNGEFVVGGYNEARLDGSLHWSNFSDMSGDRPCPLRTVIRDLLLTYENDTEVTLKSGGESIAACIEPYDDIFRFTPSMLLNWKHLTGFDEQLQGVYSSSNNKDRLSFVEEGLLYNASKTAKFSLTLTLENGYTATIPPSELQAPLRGWNSRGERVTVPDVVQVAIHNTPTGRGEIPTLGRVFLSPVSFPAVVKARHGHHQFRQHALVDAAMYRGHICNHVGCFFSERNQSDVV
jgi:hypothetical protein